MPAIQRGSTRKLPSGKHQLRYYDNDGNRKTGGVFASKSAAMLHFRNAIEPRLNGTEPTVERTFSELVDTYLERHGQIRSAATIRTLRHRLRRPLDAYGDITLRELRRDGRRPRRLCPASARGRLRYRLDEVEAWLEARATTGTADRGLSQHPNEPRPPRRRLRAATVLPRDAARSLRP
jgi:hypothetical protein